MTLPGRSAAGRPTRARLGSAVRARRPGAARDGVLNHGPRPRPSGSRTMLATVALEVRCAVALLVRLRAAPAAVDRTGSAWFGLVGAVLGALAGSVTLALGERALLAAALALVVLAVASGALHLGGLADTADAFPAPDSPNAERARRDPAIGAAGGSW